MSISLIIPEATTNQVLNPSAEIAGNFAAVGGAATRVTTYSTYDVYSYRVQTTGDNEGITLTLGALANAIHYVTVRAQGTLPAAWDWSLNNAAYTAPTLLSSAGDWDLYGLEFPAAQANGSTTLRIYQNGAGAGDFYIDGVQVEEKAYWTTYCDGEQDGCEWNGAAHAATSTRSAQARAGGLVVDLADYNISVDTLDGLGMPPVRHNIQDMALQPGGLMDNVKVLPRVITLICHTDTATHSALYAARRDLINAIKADRVAPLQPFILRYEDGNVQVEAECYYDAGLEGSFLCNHEAFALRLLAYDPFLYEVGESSQILDANDTFANCNYIMGRIGGVWNDINQGTDNLVRNIILAPDGTIYVAGNFHNAGGAAAWHIAQYDPNTDTWSQLGAGLNGNVWALALDPDGDLYAGGFFTDLQGGGLANANYIARWDGIAWNAMAAGFDSVCDDIAIGLDGTVYAVGGFTNGGALDYIAYWTGAAWAPLSADDLSGAVNTIAIGLDGYIYVGGDFHDAGGVTCYHVAFWDGTAWNAMGPGLDDGLPYEITVGIDNKIYVGGDFVATYDSSVTLNYIGVWNGESWAPLGVGMNGDVRSISIGPDGLIHVGGNFTEAGGIATPDKLARWDGSIWSHWDIDLPGAPRIWKVLVGAHNPVVPSLYNLYIGFTTSGTAYAAGLATASNDGSATSYPRIVISRAGGTTAKLEFVRNETTGKILLFDRDILDAETLTIDLTPGVKTATSSFFGNIIGSILPDSDFATFALAPGDNAITCYVSGTGNPVIIAYVVWRNVYWGVGGMEP